MSELVRSVVMYGPEALDFEPGYSENLYGYAEHLSQMEGGLVVVSAGAMAAGRVIANRFPGVPDSVVKNPEVLAGVGRPQEARDWQQSLWGFGRLSANFPVAPEDARDPSRRSSLVDAVKGAAKANLVSLLTIGINSDRPPHKEKQEIFTSRLAELIAVSTGAKRLFFMTNVDGLVDEYGRAIAVVPYSESTYSRMLAMGAPSGAADVDELSLSAKIGAAKAATKAGVGVYIAAAGKPFEEIIAGNSGTYFEPKPVN